MVKKCTGAFVQIFGTEDVANPDAEDTYGITDTHLLCTENCESFFLVWHKNITVGTAHIPVNFVCPKEFVNSHLLLVQPAQPAKQRFDFLNRFSRPEVAVVGGALVRLPLDHRLSTLATPGTENKMIEFVLDLTAFETRSNL